MTPNLISVSPDPLVAGKTGTVCYDFDGADDDVNQVTLIVTFTCSPPPSPSPLSIVLTREEPCTTIDVPKTAQGVTIVDQSGNSADYQGTVSPP